MAIPQPWSGPPQHNPRPDWPTRDYWVQPPRIIPPPPPFEKWVPAPEQFAFGESPRDPARFQSLQRVRTLAPALPAAPPKTLTAPQHNARSDWTLEQYNANQDRFSALGTPLLPPVTGPNLPQQNSRPDWTLAQYASNQDRFSAFFPTSASIWVPAPDMFAFGELPRDMTALQRPLIARSLPLSPPPSRPPLYSPIVTSALPGRDLTAEKLVIEQSRATYLAIPIVPSGEVLLSFEFDPLDMTPYALAGRNFLIPPPLAQAIPPNVVPYIQPPGWTLNQYQALQDRFSALGTPTRPVYPPGLRPTFTIEALLRDIVRATPVYQNTIQPVVPPFQFAQPLPYIQPPPWAIVSYQQIQDGFSAIGSTLPVAAGFRCRAASAGVYGGQYYWPGDVFDIAFATDFSDATRNYQIGGNEYAAGWMLKVASTTPLFQTITSQLYPMFPPVDPNRRFVM